MVFLDGMGTYLTLEILMIFLLLGVATCRSLLEKNGQELGALGMREDEFLTGRKYVMRKRGGKEV